MNILRMAQACVLLLVLSLLPFAARAAESYDNCTGFIDSLPAAVSTQGTWCLRHDLSTNISTGQAILVMASNVTIDCNGFKVAGLSGGTGTMAMGIAAQSGKLNLTVRNCRVRGFWLGIWSEGGGGHLIEDNQLDGNTEVGIDIASPGSTVRNNFVVDTGGSTSSSNGAKGIRVSGGVDVIGNTVSGVVSNNLQSNNDARGIVAVDNAGGAIVGNRIRGLVPATSGASYGILDFTSGASVIRDNIVQGVGQAGSLGIKCQGPSITSRGNVVAGVQTPIEGCTSADDTVNP